MTPCPFCRGRGEKPPSPAEAEAGYGSRSCDECSGTGDYSTCRLMRALRFGEAIGYQRALHRLEGVYEPFTAPTWQTIQSAVTTDLRRQRHEEMLEPESRELQRMRSEIDRLVREREPLLASCASLAAELREQLVMEVPA